MKTLHALFHRFLKANQTARRAAIDAQKALYQDMQKRGEITIQDMVKTAYLHNLAGLKLPEFYLVVLGIVFILVTTGSFGFQDRGEDFPRYYFIASIVLLSFLSASALKYLFIPLHLRLLVPLSVVNGLQLLLAAIFVSMAAPWITEAFTGAAMPAPLTIFVPIAGVFGIAGTVLQARNRKHLCYIEFTKQRKKAGLDTIIPKSKQGVLHAMQAQDHYVHIKTEKGEHLHRMSLTAAINMAPPDIGIRVHRSHWVNKSQIASIVCEGAKPFVVLHSGQRHPIAKSQLKKVRALL